jgi:hypothetical protein
MLRLRNRAVIFSFRSRVWSRINNVRFVNIFSCPEPHHKCGRRSTFFPRVRLLGLVHFFFLKLRLSELVYFFSAATFILCIYFYALLIYSFRYYFCTVCAHLKICVVSTIVCPAHLFFLKSNLYLETFFTVQYFLHMEPQHVAPRISSKL